MPKFQLDVAGHNFMIRFHPTHRPKKHGFVTKFFLEAETPEAAEAAAADLLRADRSITDFICNTPDDQATLEFEKVYEIASWPDCARPRMGLAWYPEKSPKRTRNAPNRTKKI